MTKVSDLEIADRIEIFRHLAVDDLESVDRNILDLLAEKNLQGYLDFCDKVFSEKNLIQDISCEITDGELKFNINYI